MWFFNWKHHKYHCAKSVRIWSISGPYFPAFGLNTKIYRVISLFNANAGKYRPEKLQIRTLFAHYTLKTVFFGHFLRFNCNFSPYSKPATYDCSNQYTYSSEDFSWVQFHRTQLWLISQYPELQLAAKLHKDVWSFSTLILNYFFTAKGFFI